MPPRVIFTEEALSLTRRLRAENGPLIFHLSGGCCEGSAPMCFRQSDFRVGARDVLLGLIEDSPFYVGPAQPSSRRRIKAQPMYRSEWFEKDPRGRLH
jgi:uncharacterized protein